MAKKTIHICDMCHKEEITKNAFKTSYRPVRIYIGKEATSEVNPNTCDKCEINLNLCPDCQEKLGISGKKFSRYSDENSIDDSNSFVEKLFEVLEESGFVRE